MERLTIKPELAAVESEGGTQIFIQNADEFIVNQDGRQIECGHKRQNRDA
jgi:hypothetical protein